MTSRVSRIREALGAVEDEGHKVLTRAISLCENLMPAQ